jgi:gluconolactonase
MSGLRVTGDRLARDGLRRSESSTRWRDDRGAGRVFFDATAWAKTKKGAPDGMKVDREGNLFAAGPGGVHVFSPDGAHLGSLELDVPASNVAWGEDGSVLYITAATAVYRIQTGTKGAGF